MLMQLRVVGPARGLRHPSSDQPPRTHPIGLTAANTGLVWTRRRREGLHQLSPLPLLGCFRPKLAARKYLEAEAGSGLGPSPLSNGGLRWGAVRWSIGGLGLVVEGLGGQSHDWVPTRNLGGVVAFPDVCARGR